MFFFSLGLPLKFLSTEKLIWARLGVSRTIYVNVDSPNLGFPYFNFLGGTSEKITLYMFTFWRSQIDKLCQLIQKKYVNILCVVFSQSPQSHSKYPESQQSQILDGPQSDFPRLCQFINMTKTQL